MRAASPALQEWWPDGESPRSWRGVTWSDDRVQELDLRNCPVVALPPAIGQLQALTLLDLTGCAQLTLAPGAEDGQFNAQPTVAAIVAAYARLLIVEPRKDTPGQLHAFLLTNALAVPAFFKSILTDAAHADWLGAAAKVSPELAEFTDAGGRRVVDVAHAMCRRRILESAWLCTRYELQPGPPEHQSATSVVIRADDHGDKPDYAQIFKDADKAGNGTLELNELYAVAGKLGLTVNMIVSEANIVNHRPATSKDSTASNQLDQDAFVSACKRLLGDGPRKVVIKLMKDKVQWQREMTSRSWALDPATNKYVPSQSEATLDAQYVVQALDAPPHSEMAAAVSQSPLLHQLAERYMEKTGITDCLGTHTIIMYAADRNLHEIHLNEQPFDINTVKTMFKQVFEAVAHLHENKLMHGDLKMRNVVRFRVDNRLRLMDFDAAARILSEFDDTGPSCAGAKFSSATLPPEMFFELTTEAQHEQLAEYWKDAGEEQRAKVAPKLPKESSNAYVVKSFIAKDGERVTEGLPYELVDASEKIDVWMLGVLAFSLLTGETLVPTTRDDDCASGAAMQVVYNWGTQPAVVHKVLDKIKDDAAYDLVDKMLQRDPSERQTVKKLLEHPFLNPPTNRDVEAAKQLEERLKIISTLREKQREEGRVAQARKEARRVIVSPHKETLDQLHAFLLSNSFERRLFFSDILTDAAHADWLGEAVKATPELAELIDADGRRAIDVAHSTCKQAMQAALLLLDRFDVDVDPLIHRSTTAAVAAASDHRDPDAKPVPRVALKAMLGVDQVRAELEGRAGLDSKYVITVKAVYADEEAVGAGAWDTVVSAAAGLEGVVLQRVPGLSSSIQAHFFKPHARQPKKAGGLVRQATVSSLPPKHCFILVLELADRSLLQTINHDQIAGKDWPGIRHIASDLGWALDHVHGKGGIHADFKPLNAVGDRDTWKIIDFDVFCKVGEPFRNKVPSSGYCPPEMAKVLLAATNKDTGKVDDTSLLEEYIASEAYDLWSFGVVLYHLCFGTALWKTDTDDNITLSELRKLVAALDKGALRKVIDNALYHRNASTNLKVATALLQKLLEPDAQKRLAHFKSAPSFMKSVLEEPFFQGETLEAATLEKLLQNQGEMKRGQEKQMALLTAIKDLSTENKSELRRTREVLMKGIFEATEVNMPTTFIVLNKKLPDLPSEEEKERLLIQIAEDGSGVTLDGGLVSAKFSEDGMVLEAEGECKEYVDNFNTGMTWVNRLKTIGTDVAAGKVGDAFTTIKKGLGDLVTGETMYLYLVDELTCEPVLAEGYPIVITKQTHDVAQIVSELLPVMQVGLRAMSILNGAGGVARLFGYPVPKVSEAWATGVRESVELLKQESSVAQFGVVHDEVMAGSEESRSVRGQSLRVFTDFLEKNDPGLKANTSGHFAGLQRIGDLNDGTALWTTLTDPQQVKSALEARSIEREAEARKGNKYTQEQAVGGLARQAGELEAVALRAKAQAEAEEAEAKTTEAEAALVNAKAARDVAEKARGELEAAAAKAEDARVKAKAGFRIEMLDGKVGCFCM